MRGKGGGNVVKKYQDKGKGVSSYVEGGEGQKDRKGRRRGRVEGWEVKMKREVGMERARKGKKQGEGWEKRRRDVYFSICPPKGQKKKRKGKEKEEKGSKHEKRRKNREFVSYYASFGSHRKLFKTFQVNEYDSFPIGKTGKGKENEKRMKQREFF